MDADTFTRRMDGWLARAQRKRKGMPPPQVRVAASRLGIDYSSGQRERPFHTASIGKVMTATLMAQLAAEGRLEWDAPITALLPDSELRGLFVIDGTDRSHEVTVRQLLSHTSGVADYFDGPPRTFIDSITNEPDRLWSPADLLEFSRAQQKPVGAPGERFSYSDTGFVLLGRIAEECTGTPFGSLLHERLFTPSGMDHTCLLWHTVPGGAVSTSPDPAEDLDLSPLWLSGTELSRARSLSCDWAGGGLATTVDDLVRFQRALHAGVFLPPDRLAEMALPRAKFRRGIRYGEGLMTLRFTEFAPLLRGLGEPVGHIGVLGTHMFFSPALDAHVVVNFHSTAEMVRSFRCHIVIAQLLARRARGM